MDLNTVELKRDQWKSTARSAALAGRDAGAVPRCRGEAREGSWEGLGACCRGTGPRRRGSTSKERSSQGSRLEGSLASREGVELREAQRHPLEEVDGRQ